MDPYCCLKICGKSVNTTVKEEAGKNPVWNENLDIEMSDILNYVTSSFSFMPMDSDASKWTGNLFNADDLIG